MGEFGVGGGVVFEDGIGGLFGMFSLLVKLGSFSYLGYGYRVSCWQTYFFPC